MPRPLRLLTINDKDDRAIDKASGDIYEVKRASTAPPPKSLDPFVILAPAAVLTIALSPSLFSGTINKPTLEVHLPSDISFSSPSPGSPLPSNLPPGSPLPSSPPPDDLPPGNLPPGNSPSSDLPPDDSAQNGTNPGSQSGGSPSNRATPLPNVVVQVDSVVPSDFCPNGYPAPIPLISDSFPAVGTVVVLTGGQYLNARCGPGEHYGIVTAYFEGTRLSITGSRIDGWLELTNGLWVAGNYTQRVQ